MGRAKSRIPRVWFLRGASHETARYFHGKGIQRVYRFIVNANHSIMCAAEEPLATETFRRCDC